MLISKLVELGLRCPHCESEKIRGCYHDWQMMDSFVCQKCGLRWQEDFTNLEQHWRYQTGERGFIWIMCDAEHPLTPIMNKDSADDSTSRDRFVKKGIRNFENVKQ